MPRPYTVRPTPRGPATNTPCAQCGRTGAVKAYRLNPRNWRPVYRLLCTPCRARLRFVPVNYDRAYSGAGTRQD